MMFLADGENSADYRAIPPVKSKPLSGDFKVLS
jgi:hypothetical protein